MPRGILRTARKIRSKFESTLVWLDCLEFGDLRLLVLRFVPMCLKSVASDRYAIVNRFLCAIRAIRIATSLTTGQRNP